MVYRLRTTTLEYALLYERRMYRCLLATTDEWAQDSHRAMPDERPITWRATLSLDYHMYHRFADEVLALDVDTWLGVHSDGPDVLAGVRHVFDAHSDCLDRDAHEVYPRWIRRLTGLL